MRMFAIVRLSTLACSLLAAASCATASNEACQRVEQCVRRCQNAGTPAENKDPYVFEGTSLSACERQCGTCNATTPARPTSAKPPTFTGS
jgi:hypothetical protein